MSSSIHVKEDYIKCLQQAISLRREIQDISQKIQYLESLNDNSKKEIFTLQHTLASIESEKKSNESYSKSICNITQMTNSLCADNSVINSIQQSINLKKLPTKEVEIEIASCYYEINTPEEMRLKLFEHFLVIGVSQDSPEVCDLSAEILYAYPDPSFKECDLAKEIQTLAFPKGITAKPFRTDESIASQMYEVLYHSYYRDGNSFTFIVKPITIESDFGYSEMINNEKSMLYCCCVIFDDLIMNSYFGNQYIVPRCYCFVTYFPCFELHFDVLYRLLAIKRALRFENSIPMNSDSADENEKDTEILKDEELGLVETYFEYECDSSTNRYAQVNISLQSVEAIDYNFPSDYYFIDKFWFSPLIFSLLNLNDFHTLLFAVLLEKNIIFLSKNLDFLSSCVLGFQSLILPFKTQNQIVPIILEKQLQKLTNNDNFIVGFPGVFNSVLESKFTNAIIVKLDENNYSHSKIKENNSLGPKIKNITYCVTDKIKQNYAEFCDRVTYIANDTQIEAERKIFEELQKFIKWILGEVLAFVDVKQGLEESTICEKIIMKTSKCNHEFLCAIARSKIFRRYYHEL